jgi:hypothetical protein
MFTMRDDDLYDDDDFWESDREMMHEAARLNGTTASGEPLPRHTDKQGRVWVTCTCDKKFLLKPQGGEPSSSDRPLADDLP